MSRGNITELLKPGIAFSVIVTVIPGLLAGKQMPTATVAVAALFGTLLMAMSSFVYNQLLEVRTDALMERTKNRPLLTGKVTTMQAHMLGAALLALGMSILWIYATPLAALIALFSFAYYLFVYTLWLKPKTVQSTVLGGVCGAIGPLIGQAAMENRIGTAGIMLFALLFLWQPPHFWALAIAKKDDYGRASFPLLPVLHGIPETLRQMLLYQWVLLAATVAIVYPLRLAGAVFLIPSLASATLTLILIYRLRANPSTGAAMRTFFASIVHNLTWHAAYSVDLWLQIRAGG